MLCTMVGHYTFFPKDVAACYAPFFLSAFLFAAGYTFHLESSFKRFVEKKIKTVLFPWFWMGLLSLLSRQIISFNSHAGIAKDLQDFFFKSEAEVMRDGSLYAYSALKSCSISW